MTKAYKSSYHIMVKASTMMVTDTKNDITIVLYYAINYYYYYYLYKRFFLFNPLNFFIGFCHFLRIWNSRMMFLEYISQI